MDDVEMFDKLSLEMKAFFCCVGVITTMEKLDKCHPSLRERVEAEIPNMDEAKMAMEYMRERLKK